MCRYVTMCRWIIVLNIFMICNFNRIYSIKSSAENDVISKYVPIHEFGHARPITDPNRAITVLINFEIQDILEVSTTTQRLKLRGFIRLRWFNEWLNWNSTEEGNVYKINWDSSMAWTPEIVAYTSVRNAPVTEENSDDGDDDDDDDKEDWSTKTIKTELKIDSNGMTTWLSPLYLESACHFHLSEFPFDEQDCVIVFGLWSDTIEKVKLEDMNLPTLKDGFRQNVEWEVTNAISRVTDVYYECCNKPISKYEVAVRLKRKTKYYYFHFVFPVVFVILTLLMANFVSFESSERINLQLVIAVTAIFLLLIMVKTVLPPTEDVSAMSKLYLLLIGGVSLSIISTTILAVFYFNTSKLLWFPKWLERKILPKYLWRDEIQRATKDDFIDQLTGFLESEGAEEEIKGNNKALREVLRLLCEYNNSQYDEAKNERVEMRSRMLAASLDKIMFCVLFLISLLALSVVII